MTKRLLIVSTLDSNEPFGAFTRPFYLGMHLSQYFELCQLGLNCSAVDYASSISINNRSLQAYIKAIQKCMADFAPDIVYAQETLPGLAAWIVFTLKREKKCRLVFDFHTLSAFEYGTRLTSAPNPFNQLSQLVKTYIAQGTLINSGKPIIAASQGIIDLIPRWYKTLPPQIDCVSNGVADDLLNISPIEYINPYKQIRPAKIAVVIAPKTFSFPTNDMSVSMALQVAKYLEFHQQDIHLVVIGRDGEGIDQPLPANITFTGFLPNRSDFLAHLVYADVGVLPFSQEAVAGGARNKALDYLACKTLVVSTPEGIRGLEEFCDRQHLLVSGYTVEEVANTLVDASTNRENYQSLVEEAYQLIEAKYSWSAMAEKVAGILNKGKIS